MNAQSASAKLELVIGVEGSSVYLDGFRIAGSKPWGGGRTEKVWGVNRNDVLRALGEIPRNDYDTTTLPPFECNVACPHTNCADGCRAVRKMYVALKAEQDSQDPTKEGED